MSFMLNFEQFLIESEDELHEMDFLNEDYAQQAARNQERLQRISNRIAKAKDLSSNIDKAVQTYAEKAGKTQDDISKAVYEAKINSAKAKKKSYASYIIYLQDLQTYCQTKGNEIDARMKASNRRKT